MSDLRTKAAPLEARLAETEAKLAEPALVGTTVEEAVSDRKTRSDLELKRSVILEQLTPLREQIAEAEAEAARAAAKQAQEAAIDKILAQLVKVGEARQALEVEAAELNRLRVEAFGLSPVALPPELHFALQPETAAIFAVARQVG